MRTVYFFVFIFLSFSCKENEDLKQYDSTFSKLNDGESAILLNIDSNEFYNESSIFKGGYILKDKVFDLNFLDQYQSNIMVHFRDPNWHSRSPKRVKAEIIGNYASTLMVGKVKNKEANLGDGYLMTAGYLDFLVLSKNKIIIKIKGEVKKYPKTNLEDPSFPISGVIISKNPSIKEINIPL